MTARDRHVLIHEVNDGFRVARMRKVAAHLPAVVDITDRMGFAALLGKAPSTEDLHALVAILAEAADLDRLAVITGCRVPGRRGEAGTMPGEVKGAAARGERAA